MQAQNKEGSMSRRMALFVLLMLCLAVACARPSAPPLTLGPAPWQSGERLSYGWVNRNGEAIGSTDIAFIQEGEAWAILWADKVAGLDQTFTMRIRTDNLRPLGETKTLKAPNTDATISTTYSGGKLQIEAVVKGQNRSASVDVSENALDNDQLLMTLRAAPFAEGYSAGLVTVVSANASRLNTTIRVTGQEAITVPAGTYQAWRVELDFGAAKQTAWYEVEAPHNLVQYDNGANTMRLVAAAGG
ncbi:MAG: DUF3108 domain-containing protein [Thiobacillaceae bacterium]